MTIDIISRTGPFAENKDVARDIRLNLIGPALEQGGEVVLNFEGVSGATQSFIHALMSELIRKYGDDIFDQLVFKNCGPVVQEVVQMVAEYMQESI